MKSERSRPTGVIPIYGQNSRTTKFTERDEPRKIKFRVEQSEAGTHKKWQPLGIDPLESNVNEEEKK